MTTKSSHRATTFVLMNERPHTESRPPKSGAGFVRPVHPAVYSTLRIQQRTARSFETTSQPDILAGWLLDHGWKSVPKSNNTHEYARLGLGLRIGHPPAQLIILYSSGSVVVGGPYSEKTAQTLQALCGPTPETAGMFDSLADLEGGTE